MTSFTSSCVRSAWLLLSLFLLAPPNPADAWVASDQRPFPGGEAPVVVDQFYPEGYDSAIPPRIWRTAIQDAMAQWNNAGANFTFTRQNAGPFDDPCQLSGVVVILVFFQKSLACAPDQPVFDDINTRWNGVTIFHPNQTRIYLKSSSNTPLGIATTRYTILHELGHVVGLDHPNEAGQNVVAAMNLGSTHDTLQPDDILGIRALYGTAGVDIGSLESPAPNGQVSGIGFISGWRCDAQDITVKIDDGPPLDMAMGLPRADTQATCRGLSDNGFIAQINWNLIGAGRHTAVAYDNGIEFARNTFTVGTTGEEFLRGVTVSVDVPNFPAPGETGRFVWNESTQHLELAGVIPAAQEEPDPTPEEPTIPASSVSRFNGTWRFTIQYTTDSNFCHSNSGQEVTCTVVNGVLSCPYRDKVQGIVSHDGAFSAHDGGNIRTLRGHLEGNSGSGTWDNAISCDGTWTATKQSSFDHITRPTCSTLHGLEVDDYWGDPGRWDITIPCAPWQGYANVLHIDIVPLSPEGFDVDPGDLLIVQGEKQVTYDEDNPNLTEALIWMNRQTQAVIPPATILDYRLTEAPYPTTVIAGQNTGLDFRQPFTVYYDDTLVAIFE